MIPVRSAWNSERYARQSSSRPSARSEFIAPPHPPTVLEPRPARSCGVAGPPCLPASHCRDQGRHAGQLLGVRDAILARLRQRVASVPPRPAQLIPGLTPRLGYLRCRRNSEEMADRSMVAQRHDGRVDVEHSQPGSGIKITTTLHRQVPYEPARMGTHVTSLRAITDRSRIEVHGAD